MGDIRGKSNMWEWLALGGMQLANTGISFFNNRQQIRAQKAANEANIRYQREFAQNGIQWRKNDAIRAGINPIYALGAQGAQFSPSVQAESGSGIEGFNPSQFIALKQAKQAEKEGKEQIELMKSEREKNNALKALYEAQTEEMKTKTRAGAGEDLTKSAEILSNKTNNKLDDRQGTSHLFTISKTGKEEFFIGASQDSALGQKASEPSIFGFEVKYYTNKILKPEILQFKKEKEAQTGTRWDFNIDYGLAGAKIWNTHEPLQKRKSREEVMKEIEELLKYDDNRLYD